MFENVGEKIKLIAKIILGVEVTISIIAGIALLCIESTFFVGIGLALIFLGPPISAVFSLILYGFGELVDNSELNFFKFPKNN